MHTMMLATLALASLSASLQQLGLGRYDALPRDSTAHNRFQDVELELQQGGTLLWRRGGAVELVMTWRSTEEVFEVEESLGCGSAPRGAYRVARWLAGYALEAMRDGCTNRVAMFNAIYLMPKERFDPRPFTAGRFMIEQRVAANTNPYQGTLLDFLDGGVLLWIRNGSAYAMMAWSMKGDEMTISDAELCPVAPMATYRVTWKDRGFVFDRISDDCGERVRSAESMLLVPATGDLSRSLDRAVPASPANSPVPRND
jgi:hypothetical protein